MFDGPDTDRATLRWEKRKESNVEPAVICSIHRALRGRYGIPAHKGLQLHAVT